MPKTPTAEKTALAKLQEDVAELRSMIEEALTVIMGRDLSWDGYGYVPTEILSKSRHRDDD